MALRTLDDVLRRRLTTQRVTAAPLPSATDAVRHLLCVQAQDAPLAAWSLGLRSRTRTYAGVLAEQDSGTFVRTHILRPTWHYVAAEDVRWLLELTSPKVESSMGARHRQLELDEPTIGRALDALGDLLAGGTALTRKEIGPELARRGLPGPGERVGHLLLLAELRALVCSGPMGGPRGVEHTYRLLDEVVPISRSPRPVDRDEALVWMTTRFFTGHGPARVEDLVRWAAVTKNEVRRAIDAAGDALQHVDIGDEQLWFGSATPPRTRDFGGAFLLPTFDEAILTFAGASHPRTPNHRRGSARLSPAEAGGGAALVAGRDVAAWKRTVTPRGLTLAVDLEPGESSAVKDRLRAAAERLAAFVGVPLVGLRWGAGDRRPAPPR